MGDNAFYEKFILRKRIDSTGDDGMNKFSLAGIVLEAPYTFITLHDILHEAEAFCMLNLNTCKIRNGIVSRE